MNYRLSIIVSLFMMFFISCLHSNVFEKNVAITNHKWKANFKPVFAFNITDTTALYSLYLTMRHTDAYPYSNIWLLMNTTQVGENIPASVKIEVPLAQADGKWLGRGMNEVWEHKMPLTREGSPLKFAKQGFYKIQLQQIMRVDPLPEVMSIGIRLEKNQ